MEISKVFEWAKLLCWDRTFDLRPCLRMFLEHLVDPGKNIEESQRIFE